MRMQLLQGLRARTSTGLGFFPMLLSLAPTCHRAAARSALSRQGYMHNDQRSQAAARATHRLPPGVDLLGVHAVLGVQILHLAVREHAVELAIGLELVAELREQCQALLLPRQLQQVGPPPA